MKKYIAAIFMVIMLSLMFTCALAAADNPAGWQDQALLFNKIADREGNETEPKEMAFRLPAVLLVIEDEAFEGTAIVNVDLPDTVESIGDHAFANIPSLRSVKIPENTKKIARTAFAGSGNVTLTGVPGSYARTWARENGVPFAPIAVMHAGAETVQTSAGLRSEYEPAGAEGTDSMEWAQKRPRWKASNEIQSERYDKWFANQISGRAPPTAA